MNQGGDQSIRGWVALFAILLLMALILAVLAWSSCRPSPEVPGALRRLFFDPIAVTMALENSGVRAAFRRASLWVVLLSPQCSSALGGRNATLNR